METNETLEFLGNSFSDSRTKTSVILSGGADLAVFFELGAMSLLEKKLGMQAEKLHLIAGGSGGSISGFLKAASVDCDQPGIVPRVEEVLKRETSKRKGIHNLGFYSQEGVIQHLEKLVNSNFRHFRDLPVDLRITSTMIFPHVEKICFSRDNCMLNGKEVTTYEAIGCSISVPLLYKPFKIGNTFHLDGETMKPIPIEEGKDSDVMVVISVYGPYKGLKPMSNPGAFLENYYNHLRKRELMKRIKEQQSYNPKQTVVLIENNPKDYNTANYRKFSLTNENKLKAAGRDAVSKGIIIGSK